MTQNDTDCAKISQIDSDEYGNIIKLDYTYNNCNELVTTIQNSLYEKGYDTNNKEFIIANNMQQASSETNPAKVYIPILKPTQPLSTNIDNIYRINDIELRRIIIEEIKNNMTN